MTFRPSLRFALLVASIFFVGTFSSSPAYGDNVTLTLTSTNLTAPEAGPGPTLDFTLSNNSGSPIEVWTGGIAFSYGVTFSSGDPTDQVISHFGFPLNLGTCTGPVATGSSCTFSAGLVQLLDPPSAVEDADFGVDLVDFTVKYVPCDPATGGCSSTPASVDSLFEYTVVDAGATVPTPEPSTLMFLGTGLLGLMVLAYRRI
jgi:hypothetical protein